VRGRRTLDQRKSTALSSVAVPWRGDAVVASLIRPAGRRRLYPCYEAGDWMESQQASQQERNEFKNQTILQKAA